MTEIDERIRNSSIRKRIMSAAQAVDLITSDMTIGCSGLRLQVIRKQSLRL
ncbi:MAG: hypothetical protein ACQEQG_09400 [Bacillota bacterium]